MLLLTGWTDYAFSSDNIAAHQAGLPLHPPSLQVRDASGRWQTAIEEIGIPVGRPQTIVVDLSKCLRRPREVRIVTSMRVYWDRVQVATWDRTRDAAADDARRHRRRICAGAASRRKPRPMAASRTATTTAACPRSSPWKLMPGRYTREGDVARAAARRRRPVRRVAAGRRAGAVLRRHRRCRALPAGWTRTFLLHSVGYSKEMDLNSASPDQASAAAVPHDDALSVRRARALVRAGPGPATTRASWIAGATLRCVGRALPRAGAGEVR